MGNKAFEFWMLKDAQLLSVPDISQNYVRKYTRTNNTMVLAEVLDHKLMAESFATTEKFLGKISNRILFRKAIAEENITSNG